MTYADDLFADEPKDQAVTETDDQVVDVPEDHASEQDSAPSGEASSPVGDDPISDGPTATETEVPEDVEPTPDEVSLEDVEVSDDMPLSDAERLAYKLLKRASQLKGVAIPREGFLRGELSKHCEPRVEDAAMAASPREAGVSLDVLDELADAAIVFETSKVAGISALSSAPGGLLGVGTIPADILQYVAHALRMAQKLAYLYGWPSFAADAGDIDDDALYELILLLGVMMQVEGTALTLAQVSDDISQAGAKESLRQRFGEDGWYQPIREVLAAMGAALTKGAFVGVMSRGIPLLSGLISGGLTYATFRPAATALKKLLRALPQATGEVMPDDQMSELITQIEEEAKVALDESLHEALESVGEKAGTFVSQMGDAADDITDRFGEAAAVMAEQASSAAGVMADKAAEYAAAARDKAVDAAKAAAIGFIKGIGTSKRDKRRKKGEKGTEQAATAPEATASTAPANEYAQELRLLKALLDDGIITQEEFDAKKRQLLGL